MIRKFISSFGRFITRLFGDEKKMQTEGARDWCNCPVCGNNLVKRGAAITVLFDSKAHYFTFKCNGCNQISCWDFAAEDYVPVSMQAKAKMKVGMYCIRWERDRNSPCPSGFYVGGKFTHHT